MTTDTLNKTPLHLAAEHNDVAAARRLLDEGADLEARTSWGATALDWAGVLGSTAVAELLLERGAQGYSLATAAGIGRRGDVERLMPGADAAALANACYLAARNGHADIVALLLDAGAPVDARGFFGGTGLHWAAINGHRAAIELLLARGADRTLKDDRFDATPADWAREGGHEELAALLRV